MCVIQSWPQLSHLTLPAGVRVSSVIFRQVGSNRQFSRLKMVTDNCLQLYFVNFQRMELNYYAHSGGAIRRHSDPILAQRGNTVWWQITWVIGHSGTVSATFHVGLQMLISAVSNMNLQVESSTSVTAFFLLLFWEVKSNKIIKWSVIAFKYMGWISLHF